MVTLLMLYAGEMVAQVSLVLTSHCLIASKTYSMRWSIDIH